MSHVLNSFQQEYLYITSFHVYILLPPFMMSVLCISFPLLEQSAIISAKLRFKM